MPDSNNSHQQFNEQRRIRRERYYYYIVIAVIAVVYFCWLLNLLYDQTAAAFLNGTAGTLFLIYTFLYHRLGWKLYFITGITYQLYLVIHSIYVLPGVHIESGIGIFTVILPLIFQGKRFYYFFISNAIFFHLPLLMGCYEDAFESNYLLYLGGFVFIYFMKKERDLSELKILQQQQELLTQIEENTRLQALNMALAEKQRESEWLTKLTQIIEQRMTDFDLKIEDLAIEMEISRTHFFRKVKELTGFTPNQYLTELRLRTAHELLQNNQVDSVKSAHLTVGIRKASHFTNLYKKRFGRLPSASLKMEEETQ